MNTFVIDLPFRKEKNNKTNDRGFGQSTGNFATGTSLDFSYDVESAVEYLRTRKEIQKDKIGITSAMPISIIETTLGPIEVRLVGKGRPLLFIHGGHVDCRETIFQKGLDPGMFQFICPSRIWTNSAYARHLESQGYC